MAKPKTDDTTALAPVGATATALATREGADAKDTRGKENFDQKDLVLPRLALVQRTSPEIDPDSDRYIPGAKFTDMVNSLTRENYGAGPVLVLPLGMRKRAMVFGEGGTVLDFDVPLSVDPETGEFEDDRLRFTGVGDKRQKPVATLFYEFPVLIVGQGRQDIAVLSLKGTQLKAARDFATIINYRKGASWEGQYEVRSTRKDFPKGPAALFAIRPAGPAATADAEAAERAYRLLQSKNVVTDMTGANDGDDEAGDGRVPF
jgi:hypothetical protein